MKYQIGDKVKCVDKGASHESSDAHGAGWKLGLVFTVDHLTTRSPVDILWPASGSGVYADAVELLDKKDVKDLELRDVIAQIVADLSK